MNIANLTPAQLRQAADLKEKIAVLEKQLTGILADPGSAIPAPFLASKSAKPAKRKLSASHLAKIRAAQKLRWSKVKAAKAKTGARRLAPITDNLFAWLEPHVKETGAVLGFESWWNQIPKLVDAVNERRKQQAEEARKKPESVRKFQWKHNALRHSFCSYRLAGTKNAAQVALEAGNSPQMIFAHYRQLVTETEAAKWFGVMPSKPAENVIPLQIAANA